MGERLQFVVTVKAEDAPSLDHGLDVIVRQIALELRRSWNEQFPAGRVTEITVAGPGMDYSIGFDVPPEDSGVRE